MMPAQPIGLRFEYVDGPLRANQVELQFPLGRRKPRWIIWHWDAGQGKFDWMNRKKYHFICDREGRIWAGDRNVSDNCRALMGLKDTEYAAHVALFNGDAIGVCLAGQFGAIPGPAAGNRGKFAVTDQQQGLLIDMTVQLARIYRIPAVATRGGREGMMGHGEVALVKGIDQQGRWEMGHMSRWPTADASQTGGILRGLVGQRLDAARRARGDGGSLGIGSGEIVS